MHKLTVQLFLSFTLATAVFQTPSLVTAKTEVTKVISEKTFKQKAADVIERWKQEVAKEEQFSDFSKANYTIQPLGPGTRAYLVTFFEDELQTQSIGYLILHSAETGALYVGEYGKGLFEGLLNLTQSPSTTVYVHPFEVIYIDEENETFDLYTNESYPIALDVIKAIPKQAPLTVDSDDELNYTSSFNYSLATSYFSPYEKLVWLKGTAINNQLLDDRSIETELEFDQQLYYRTKNWNNSVSTVFSITALHKWDENKLYIGIQLDDEDTIRFIPYTQLLQLGNVYSS